jgi:hypothetical protein
MPAYEMLTRRYDAQRAATKTPAEEVYGREAGGQIPVPVRPRCAVPVAQQAACREQALGQVRHALTLNLSQRTERDEAV